MGLSRVVTGGSVRIVDYYLDWAYRHGHSLGAQLARSLRTRLAGPNLLACRRLSHDDSYPRRAVLSFLDLLSNWS
jgi:hypothetical protein